MKVNNSLIILLALFCATLFIAPALAVDEKKSHEETTGQLNAAKQGQDGWGHGGGGGGCYGRGCHGGGGGHGGGGYGCRYGCCGGYGRGGFCRQCCKTAQESLAYMQNEANHP